MNQNEPNIYITKENIADIFIIDIGADASFICRERRVGEQDPAVSFFSSHDIARWIIRSLSLEPYKRYKIAVKVKLLEELEK